MAAAGEKDKKAVSKIVVINDLWVFYEFLHKVWMQEWDFC